MFDYTFETTPKCEVESFSRGDRVRIDTARNPEAEGIKSYLVTDKPLLAGELRPKPIFIATTGTVVKVDTKKYGNRKGSLRVKFDATTYGFSLCEFPCYDEDLVVDIDENGNNVYGAYAITKL